ncbi:MAG: response regulator [Rhodospirillales bacterium]|nr:response regulator [Rhodospirillales bacterium]
MRLLLAESNPQIRKVLKTAFYAQGFRDIIEAGHYEQVRECVVRNLADVMVCDYSVPGGDISDLVHSMRHHRCGNNPFVLVIGLVGRPTSEEVRRIISSGTDDLIVKPLSPEQVIDRIGNLVRGRKKFVVTHDYIGPDRRKEPRPGTMDTPLIEVPNPLRMKALGGNTDPSHLQRLIDSAAARINEQKMESYAVQVIYLVERIVEFYAVPGSDLNALVDNLQRLQFVGEDLSRRLRGTPLAHVSELALSLGAMCGRILERPTQPDERDLELLGKLCQAINRAFSPEQRTAQAALEISRSVASYAKREG